MSNVNLKFNAMTTQTSSLKSLLQQSHEYLETRYDLVRLKTIDKSSDVLSSTATFIIITVAVLFFLMMASIGLALYLGYVFDSLYLGFFCVAGFYLLVVIILFATRKQLIKTPIYNSIIRKIL